MERSGGPLPIQPDPAAPRDILLTGILARFPAIAGRIDADGVVTEIEGAGLDRFAIAPGDLCGVNLLSTFPDLRPSIAPALAGGTADFHWEGTIQDELCHLEVSFFFDQPRGAGACFFVRDLTESKKLEHEVLAISEAGHQRIGADLHDGLGQHLTGIACLTTALAGTLKAAGLPECAAAEEIARLVRDAIAQTRAIARGLSPVQMEHYGLQSALEDLAYEIHRLHGIECRFDGHAANPVYDHATAVNLYRIAQEAVNNALKHAAPSRIRIRLALAEDRGTLSIEDDGKGFVPATGKKSGDGLGLRIMGYRASMIGGTLEISGRPRDGTLVQCRFPNPLPPS